MNSLTPILCSYLKLTGVNDRWIERIDERKAELILEDGDQLTIFNPNTNIGHFTIIPETAELVIGYPIPILSIIMKEIALYRQVVFTPTPVGYGENEMASYFHDLMQSEEN